jgi:hypothetical protein
LKANDFKMFIGVGLAQNPGRWPGWHRRLKPVLHPLRLAASGATDSTPFVKSSPLFVARRQIVSGPKILQRSRPKNKDIPLRGIRL